MAILTAMPIVDAHAHIFTRAMPLVDEPRHSPTYDFTLQDYVDTLDNHGVRYGVIAAASPWGDYNDYTIASVRNHPRLRGTVIVKPEVESYILRRMKDDGIVGVRLPFIGLARIPDLRSFEYRRLLRRIADLDWHVHLHVEGRLLPEIFPLLEASGVRIVIDHLGRPEPGEGVGGPGFGAMVASVERGRTWVKVSGKYRIGAGATEVLDGLMARVGPDRLVWGSDCPFVGKEDAVTYQQTIDWVHDALPDDAARRKVFSINALALYGFEA